MENAEELLRLIDQRARMHQTRMRHWGTVVQRDTTGPGAQVVFDGSTVAMPVKVVGGVFAQPADRCLLDLYGSDWVVSGSWAAVALGESGSNLLGPPGGSGNLSSPSYLDVTEYGPVGFTKAYDLTYVRIAVGASAFCNTTPGTSVRWGVRITPDDASSPYPATDHNVGSIYYNQTGVHMQGYWAVRVVGTSSPGGLPAGDYTCQLRWLRWGGTGTIQFDQSDYFVMELDEGIRTINPFL